jgi:hypothetical protein
MNLIGSKKELKGLLLLEEESWAKFGKIDLV